MEVGLFIIWKPHILVTVLGFTYFLFRNIDMIFNKSNWDGFMTNGSGTLKLYTSILGLIISTVFFMIMKIRLRIPFNIHLKVLLFWISKLLISYYLLLIFGEILIIQMSIRMVYFFKAGFLGMLFSVLGAQETLERI